MVLLFEIFAKKNELNTFIITAVDWIYVALEGATVLPVETFTIKQPSERWNKSKTKRIQEKKKGHLSKKKKKKTEKISSEQQAVLWRRQVKQLSK